MQADTNSTIRIEHDGPLTILSIDSPPLNLFDQRLMDELERAVERLAAEPPRGLLIRAEGRVVSGGVDVHVFDGLSVPDAGALWERLLGMVHRVERLPAPTVFAAHGLCLTAAFELSLGCDLLLAAQSARFGLVETVVGLTPAMGGTQRLAERAGPARARELVMTGALYDAATLERWNVVNRVLPDEGFAEAARAFALGLAQGPTRAHAATKAIVRAALDEGGTHAADRRVPELAGALFETEDLKGAVRSFLQRGPWHASYEGR
jgi:enoyl-CoA hydratase